jgi:hypothetical protein
MDDPVRYWLSGQREIRAMITGRIGLPLAMARLISCVLRDATHGRLTTQNSAEPANNSAGSTGRRSLPDRHRCEVGQLGDCGVSRASWQKGARGRRSVGRLGPLPMVAVLIGGGE